MYYTNEQIKELKKLDVIKHFDTVLDSQFKRGTTSEQDNAVADIYDAATGGKVSRTFACKSCVYNLYRNAGELYRKSIDFQKKENMRKAREAKEAKQQALSKNGTDKSNNNENKVDKENGTES